MKPSNVDLGRVEGRFIVGIQDGADVDDEPDFIAAQGTIEFTASVPYLPDPTASPVPVTLLKTTIRGMLDSQGYLCSIRREVVDGKQVDVPGTRGLSLVATNDPDLLVQNWTWNVTYRFTAVNGSTPSIPAHGIAVPMGATVDLTTTLKVPSSPGYGLPQSEAAVLRAEAAALEIATTANETLAEASEYASDAESAKNTAVQAAATATAPTDAMVAGKISDPASLTGTALSAAIGEALAELPPPPADAKLTPLVHISKARTGPFRILLTGTSIGNGLNSPIKFLVEQLKTLYGDSGHRVLNLGVAGGSYELAVNGWKKQPFGGPQFVRLRGDSTATPYTTQAFYCDRVAVYWSRETNGAAYDVAIDGASQGTIGAPGAQAYSMKTEYTVPLGSHTVTLTPPATGFAYPERIEFYTSTRKGIEFVDGTLGGSSINSMVSLRAAQGAQVAGIAISGNTGLDSYFNNTGFDAILWSGPVNDAGAGSIWMEGGYITATDYMAEKTRANGIPILGVIEMGGHYLDPAVPVELANYQTAKARMMELGQRPNITIVDWDTPTAMADLVAYRARYYAGDFIHPTDYGYEVAQKLVAQRLAMPAADVVATAALKDQRISTLTNGYGADRTVTIDGANVYFPAASRAGVQFIASGESGGSHTRPVPVYRHPAATVTGDTTARRNEIAASVNSTEYGKYVDMASKAMGLSFFASYKTGEKVWLTVVASGSITIRVDGGSTNNPRAYVDGVPVMPTTSTSFVYITGGTAPVTVSVQIGASDVSGSTYISGRVYDVAMTKSSLPMLV